MAYKKLDKKTLDSLLKGLERLAADHRKAVADKSRKAQVKAIARQVKEKSAEIGRHLAALADEAMTMVLEHGRKVDAWFLEAIATKDALAQRQSSAMPSGRVALFLESARFIPEIEAIASAVRNDAAEIDEALAALREIDLRRRRVEAKDLKRFLQTRKLIGSKLRATATRIRKIDAQVAAARGIAARLRLDFARPVGDKPAEKTSR